MHKIQIKFSRKLKNRVQAYTEIIFLLKKLINLTPLALKIYQKLKLLELNRTWIQNLWMIVCKFSSFQEELFKLISTSEIRLIIILKIYIKSNYKISQHTSMILIINKSQNQNNKISGCALNISAVIIM